MYKWTKRQKSKSRSKYVGRCPRRYWKSRKVSSVVCLESRGLRRAPEFEEAPLSIKLLAQRFLLRLCKVEKEFPLPGPRNIQHHQHQFLQRQSIRILSTLLQPGSILSKHHGQKARSLRRGCPIPISRPRGRGICLPLKAFGVSNSIGISTAGIYNINVPR
jgi:hypothetical protein